MTGKPKGHGKYELLCDCCGVEIFVDTNMVMLNDSLWLEVNNGQMEGALCDKCIELKLSRPINRKDFKESNNVIGTPLCNLLWLKHKSSHS